MPCSPVRVLLQVQGLNPLLNTQAETGLTVKTAWMLGQRDFSPEYLEGHTGFWEEPEGSRGSLEYKLFPEENAGWMEPIGSLRHPGTSSVGTHYPPGNKQE